MKGKSLIIICSAFALLGCGTGDPASLRIAGSFGRDDYQFRGFNVESFSDHLPADESAGFAMDVLQEGDKLLTTCEERLEERDYRHSYFGDDHPETPFIRDEKHSCISTISIHPNDVRYTRTDDLQVSRSTSGFYQAPKTETDEWVFVQDGKVVTKSLTKDPDHPQGVPDARDLGPYDETNKAVWFGLVSSSYFGIPTSIEPQTMLKGLLPNDDRAFYIYGKASVREVSLRAEKHVLVQDESMVEIHVRPVPTTDKETKKGYYISYYRLFTTTRVLTDTYLGGAKKRYLDQPIDLVLAERTLTFGIKEQENYDLSKITSSKTEGSEPAAPGSGTD